MARPAFVFDAYGTLYDVQSPAAALEAIFPGKGTLAAQLWRQKQLEYTWLRTAMAEFRDFAVVTREALRFALHALDLHADDERSAELFATWQKLEPFPDAAATLRALAPHTRAILSNGGQAMLDELVERSGLGDDLDAVISVDAAEAFKPSPRAYRLVEERLGARPEDVVFVSGNSFDAVGAKRFGFRVAWLERVSGAVARRQLDLGPPDATTFFTLLRSRPDQLGFEPDWIVPDLRSVVSLEL